MKSEFPNDYQSRIERLSEYMASTGKIYKNHLATIRSWARRDGQKPQEAGGRRPERTEGRAEGRSEGRSEGRNGGRNDRRNRGRKGPENRKESSE